MDILFLLIINLAVILTGVFVGEPIRIILGIPYILLIPGYSLVAAIFTRKDALPVIERFALSLGLSIVIVPLIGLILNYTPWGINYIPSLICTTFFVTIMSIVAVFRRHQLPGTMRFGPEMHLRFLSRNKLNKSDRSTNLILGLFIIVTVSMLFFAIVNVKSNEKYTDFFILGKNLKAADYPRELVLGEQVEVILGIINEEQQDTNYSVDIKINGVEIGKIPIIDLNPGEKWEQTVSFMPQNSGENQKINFLLFKERETQPYRTLNIWINVKGTR